MKEELTIFVPIYNEVESIDRLHSELGKYIESKKDERKIYVLYVNDGSTDGSEEKLRQLCSGSFRYISLDRNRGLSTAMKAAFDHVDTALVGYIDADLQTTPEDFDILLEYVNDYELVTGQRTKRDDSIVKKFSSKVGNGIRRHFTHDTIADTGCPLKILRTDVAKRIPMFDGMHRFLPALVTMMGGNVKAIPVRHFPRTAGVAKYGMFNRMWKPLMDCFAVRWMMRRYTNYSIKK